MWRDLNKTNTFLTDFLWKVVRIKISLDVVSVKRDYFMTLTFSLFVVSLSHLLLTSLLIPTLSLYYLWLMIVYFIF
jgi:hypothetical protein